MSVFLLMLGLCSYGVAAENNSQTPKKPVTDEYQGVKVEDNYQWLENDADPAVKAWSDTQNQKTRAYIDKLPAGNFVRAKISAAQTTTNACDAGIG